MDGERPGATYTRDEEASERLDRNYHELLQELRVAQTGAQILFAFLLAIAFQRRFEDLTDLQRGLYVGTLLCAAAAVVMFIAPVAIRRSTVGRRVKDDLVAAGGRIAVAGLCCLALAMLGAILLTVGLVETPVVAAAATAAAGVVVVVMWLAVPRRLRGRGTPRRSDTENPSGLHDHEGSQVSQDREPS